MVLKVHIVHSDTLSRDMPSTTPVKAKKGGAMDTAETDEEEEDEEVVVKVSHSDAKQGTFRPNTGNIQTQHREHLDPTQGTFRPNTGNIQTQRREHSDPTQGTFRPTLGTFRPYTGNI
jgi:hypothetical protein